MPARMRSDAQAPTTQPPSIHPTPPAAADFWRKLLGEVADVVAVVAVLGHFPALGEGRDRQAELLDLAAEVVEVVLARDLVADGLEDAAQQVADERATCVADGQRTGRVGADELDVDALRFVGLAAAVVEPRVADGLSRTARREPG